MANGQTHVVAGAVWMFVISVLLFWLWLTAYAILLGAEINAEAEQQTIADTTRGEAQPLGKRGAVKADSVPSEDPEAPQQER